MTRTTSPRPRRTSEEPEALTRKRSPRPRRTRTSREQRTRNTGRGTRSPRPRTKTNPRTRNEEPEAEEDEDDYEEDERARGGEAAGRTAVPPPAAAALSSAIWARMPSTSFRAAQAVSRPPVGRDGRDDGRRRRRSRRRAMSWSATARRRRTLSSNWTGASATCTGSRRSGYRARWPGTRAHIRTELLRRQEQPAPRSGDRTRDMTLSGRRTTHGSDPRAPSGYLERPVQRARRRDRHNSRQGLGDRCVRPRIADRHRDPHDRCADRDRERGHVSAIRRSGRPAEHRRDGRVSKGLPELSRA